MNLTEEQKTLGRRNFLKAVAGCRRLQCLVVLHSLVVPFVVGQ
jgi:hypothetical protein